MSFLNVAGVLKAIGSPANAEVISLCAKRDSKDDRVPIPSHRHASPSAPWPWVDLDDEVDREQLMAPAPPIPAHCPHDSSCNNCWTGYPQSRFPHWTYTQIAKSKILKAITAYNTEEPCIIYRVEVSSKGFFSDMDSVVAEHGNEEGVWQTLLNQKSPPNVRVRGLFIENLSGPILQMLGTKYNIEPYYWSSSLNWIPSRFQADVLPQIGDSLTITLTFLKSVSDKRFITRYAFAPTDDKIGTQGIDTHAPLVLSSTAAPRCLVQDLLSIHLTRNINGSTIISYHPTLNLPTTTASFFHNRILLAGQSAHWQPIFQTSPDPTFIFLTFIWHALFAWDQAIENLYDHICFLETRVTADIQLTHELHIIRAHQLHYTSLLEDYVHHLEFIMESSNPMLDNPRFTDQDRRYSNETMLSECQTLLVEIQRLKNGLQMQQRRLTNVLGLVFSSMNMLDSKYMGQMVANVKASSAIMQIAYLTIMLFLPASFAASFFKMNVRELTPDTKGTLGKYFATAIPLTAFTAWIIISFQFKSILPEGSRASKRLAWPAYLILKKIRERKLKAAKAFGGGVGSILPISVAEYLDDDEKDGEKDDPELYKL